MSKKMIYFPSFSAGAFGNGCRSNQIMKNDVTCRFWSSEFPEKFRYPYFLWPAGHFYKKKNVMQTWGFDTEPDSLLFGDSGGYQIASGAIKWDVSFRNDILRWLEENSNIAMNLDIPPRLKYEGKFDECLEISKENIKYFHENRTGKTKFLNVIQGNDEISYKKWYELVKDYDFEGWSIGGAGGSIYRFFSGILAFLSGKEHLKDYNKYFHVLGTSKIIDFMIIAQLQKSLNEVGSKTQVTTDSSSPNRATVYGTIYHGYDLKDCSFKSCHWPKSHIEHGRVVVKNTHNSLVIDREDFKLPVLNEFHQWLSSAYDYSDIREWTPLGYIISVLHNFYLFKDAIKEIEYYINGEQYILEQVVSKKTFTLLQLIDKMVKSDDPTKIFNKYKSFLIKVSDEYTDVSNLNREFF